MLPDLGLGFLIAGYLVLALFVSAEGRPRRSASSRTFRSGGFDRRSTALVGGGFGVGLLLPIALDALNVATYQITLAEGLASMAVMVTGLAIRVWAANTLGRFYTRTLLVEPEHKVVTTGLYGKVRHPGYLGSILLWSGFGGITSNVAVTVLFPVLFVAIYLYRIGAEERMLVSELGEAYIQYQRRTSKLLPFVY